jgi:hypothetical protein
MEAAEEERSGVLVLRAWVEGAAAQGLRVRITRVTGAVDDAIVEPVSSTFATVDDACTMVRVWLQELQQGLQPLPPLESR